MKSVFTYVESKPITAFLLFWLVIAIIQSQVAPIHFDEAYYWVFSQHLDWGYFDHPPMVALFIAIGKFMIPGILGVRLLTIVSSVFSIWVLYKLTSQTYKLRFNAYMFIYIIVLLPLFHLYSFITTPDVPLLISTILMLYFYKRFIEYNDLSNAIAWGLCMTLMMYSKYHGALAILLIISSNHKLFLNWKALVAMGFSFLLWLPHFYWQYMNDFVSFEYHLFYRSGNVYWYDPLKFLFNLMIVFNPFLLFQLIILWKSKWEGQWEKSLYFLLFGFIFFFGATSLKSGSQIQWLMIPTIPFIILMNKNPKVFTKSYKLWSLLVSVLFFCILRLLISVDLLPSDLNIHRQEKKVNQVELEADGLPVVYFSSYKDAALHQWYSSTKTYVHSYNGDWARQNQYNLWNSSDKWHNKPVYLVGIFDYIPGGISHQDRNNGSIVYHAIDRLQARIIDHTTKIDQNGSQSFHIQFEIKNPYDRNIEFLEEGLALNLSTYDADGRSIESIPIQMVNEIIEPEGKLLFSRKIKFNNSKDIEKIGFSFRQGYLPLGPSYHRMKLK